MGLPVPIKYKYPAYLGNSFLLLFGLLGLEHGYGLFGIILIGLAVLNLFLVYKLDTFSREEVWLRHQLELTKMREELLTAQRHIEDLEVTLATRGAGPDPNTGTAAASFARPVSVCDPASQAP